MKKYSILLAIVSLVLASLACQTIMGGGDGGFDVPEMPDAPQTDGGDAEIPTIPPVIPGGDDITIGGESEFPMPADAVNVVNMGNTVLNFQTKLSLDESMSFYRDEFGKSGYTERKELTVTAGGTFSMVFDGHASGQATTVQGVDFGDGTVNISITLVDI